MTQKYVTTQQRVPLPQKSAPPSRQENPGACRPPQQKTKQIEYPTENCCFFSRRGTPKILIAHQEASTSQEPLPYESLQFWVVMKPALPVLGQGDTSSAPHPILKPPFRNFKNDRTKKVSTSLVRKKTIYLLQLHKLPYFSPTSLLLQSSQNLKKKTEIEKFKKSRISRTRKKKTREKQTIQA